MANEKEIVFEEFYANSFMGIDKSQSVVIDFTARRKNQNIAEFVADERKGKSSRLIGILYALGARAGLDKKNLINLVDGKIDEGVKVRVDGVLHHIIVSTNRVEIKSLDEEKDKWTKIDEEPMAWLKETFGPVGLSPFSARALKARKQIEYFQEMFGSGEDASKQMQKLEAEYDEKYSKRRDINRDAKQLSSALEIEPLYQNYEKSQARFKTTINAKNEQAKFDDLSSKKTAYENYVNTVAVTEGELRDIDNTIENLEKQLAAAKERKVHISESVEKGKKWLADNKSVLTDYEKVNKEWVALSQTLADQEKWKDILKREKQFNDKTAESVELSGEIDAIEEKILKLTRKCIPKVEGLEIKLALGIDKTGKEEGVFYNGKSISILSESEYIDLWCLIFEAAGMNVIVIENITSLGSDTVATLNRLVKNGAQIFATRVDRKEKKVKVVFSSKFD